MNQYLHETFNNPAYASRLGSDKLFLTETSYAGDSVANTTARFVSDRWLTNPELWKTFFDQFYLRRDVEDLGWRGEYWGKMMRGACFTYRLTRDKKLYRVLEDAIRGLIATADKEGRIASYPRRADYDGWDMWSRKYVLLGFEYFCDICTDEDFKNEIIEAAKRHLDVIVKEIGPGEEQKSILTTSGWWGSINSCSILEPVMKLYTMTGKKEYLDFAEYILSTGGCNLGNVLELAMKGEIPPYQYPVVKAYETMSFFEGVLEYYRLTGKKEYRDAIVNFTDAVLATDYTIIGNSGCTHELFDNSTEKQTEKLIYASQETCVAVTLNKFLYQMLCITGDAKYAEAMERTYYNSILGSVNFGGNVKACLSHPDRGFLSLECDFLHLIGGMPFDSYSPLYKSRRALSTGGMKRMDGGKLFGCCACIGAMGTALFPLTQVMASEEGLYINQYIDGVAATNAPDGRKVEILTATEYPYGNKGTIRVKCEKGEKFAIALRVPSRGGKFTLNGEELQAVAGQYLAIDRAWATGDRITFEMNDAPRAVAKNGRVAIEKGCIVMAADCRNASIDTVATPNIVSATEADKDFPCRASLDVTFDNGTSVRLTDYASAGSNWDDEERYLTVWMDTPGRIGD